MRLARIIGATLTAGLAALSLAAEAAAEPSARFVLRADQPGPVIDRNIQGQFAEHLGRGVYGGIWVGENSPIPNIRGYRKDVVEALQRIKTPVVRWPGGCFADEYHWREGIGPRDQRPVRVNTHWGGVEETNAFGTHEFFEFAELIGARTYLAANIGSGSVQEMADWIEYITTPTRSTLGQLRRKNGREQPFKLDYVGIGNEAWGCGGSMLPDFYADLFRQYSTFVSSPPGAKIVKAAVGPSAGDYGWTEAVMARAGENMDALSLHYYTLPTDDWGHKGAATGFDEAQWISTMSHTLRMDELITRHSAIMDKHDPKKRVALYVDEWGAWYDSTPGSTPGFLEQQNTLRDAVLAAVNLNIFHQHADRVRMANLAQMVNVLQAMILTDGAKMVLTPTYHVFDMYQGFQDATLLPLEGRSDVYSYGGTSVPAVHASAARGKDGVTRIGLANLDPNASAKVAIGLTGLNARTVSGRVLTAATMDAHNRFDAPNAVRPASFTGARLHGGELGLVLPAKSVVVLELK